MPTATEQRFIDTMIAEGWELYKTGFPDFLCINNENAYLVEVKAHNKDALKENQLKMLTLLEKRAFEIFAWSPDNQKLVPFRDFQAVATSKPTLPLKVQKSKPQKEATSPSAGERGLASYKIISYTYDSKLPDWATPQALKALHDAGKSLRELAKMAKVSYETIRREILKASPSR